MNDEMNNVQAESGWSEIGKMVCLPCQTYFVLFVLLSYFINAKVDAFSKQLFWNAFFYPLPPHDILKLYLLHLVQDLSPNELFLKKNI